MAIVESLPALPAAPVPEVAVAVPGATDVSGSDLPTWAGSLQRMILLDLVGRAEEATADELATALSTAGADLFEAEMRALFGDA